MPEQPIHSSVRVAEKDSLRVDDAHEVVVFALMEMTDEAKIDCCVITDFRKFLSTATYGSPKGGLPSNSRIV